MKKYQLCLGHIASRSEWCEGCAVDGVNEICPYYKSVTIHVIDIEYIPEDDVSVEVDKIDD